MRTSYLKAALLTGPRRRLAALAVLAAGSLLVGGPVAAQQRPDAPVNVILRADGTPVQLPSHPSGFNLFAQEDLAGTSLRLTGSFRYPLINAGGICPFANTNGDIFNTSCGQSVGSPNFSTYFHNNVTWGIGPDDYRKIKDVWPAIANMRAPVGFSTPWRITSIAPIVIRIDAADGQFGQLFAGVTSLNGGGCRDMQGASGAGLPPNFTLLAASDCPETWAGTGFDGMREIPDSVWTQRFHADPVNFRFDDYKIPKSALGDKFLGNLTTYGAFSDYPREIVQLYGGITPLGKAGTPPGERGFPLGIYVRADAWKFDRPSLRDGVFVRWLVINNSAKVWGAPIDYDKLYMGMDPGYIPVGQRPSAYNVVSMGAHVMAGGGMSGKCNATFPKRLNSAGEACNGTQTQRQVVLLFLKSPLGDLRNKQFTDPTSPFYAPGNPKADDTITFNRLGRGDFGAQNEFSWKRSDRALFGFMAGDRDLWLDGRQFTDFTAGQIWTYFRYELTDGTQTLDNMQYNHMVPGSTPGYGKWDYNDDGIQDTLMLPDCGTQGCAGLWGDSVAGGWSNRTVGNIGNFLGVGPFQLKAGDTTEFIFYLGSKSADTVITDRLIAQVTQAYFKNYAGASSYPTPTFTANDVQLNTAWFRDSTVSAQNTEVRIQIKMPPRSDDVFLKQVLARITQNDAVAAKIRNLNPLLVATVTGRMRQNLAQVLVFKSCDDGVSWTTDNGCTSATGSFRTRDANGIDIGTGWQPFRCINVDSASGTLNDGGCTAGAGGPGTSSVYTVTENVQPGRNYLYSFVTKTRGLFDIKVTRDIVQNADGTTTVTQGTLSDVFGFDIDTITSGLSPNGPQTVHVYAPISVPAGTIYARLDTVRTQGLVVNNRVSYAARTAQVDGVFRMRFGNRWIITRTFDTLTSARTSTVIRQSLYARAATDPAGPVTTNFVAAADTFVANHDFTYSPQAAGPALRTTPRFTTGSVQTFVDTINSTGYLIGKGSGGSDPYYLWVSNSPTSFLGSLAQNTDNFEGAPWYPGFTATIQSETAPPTARGLGSIGGSGGLVLRPPYGPLDSLNANVVNGSGVSYQGGNSGLRGSPGGYYELDWQGPAFGPAENSSGFFTLGPPAAMQAAMDQSLSARPVASYTDTSAASLALIAAGTNNVLSRPLVRAKLPFTVLGINGQPATPVMVQRHRSGVSLTGSLTPVADSVIRNSRLLGSSNDTARVSVPVDMWLPGDTLYIIESIDRDSTAVIGGTATPIVHDTTVGGRAQRLPFQRSQPTYGAMLMFGCSTSAAVAPTRLTCNPIRVGTIGSCANANNCGTGWLPFASGYRQKVLLNRTFDQNSEVTLNASPIHIATTPLDQRAMDLVRVVPNPFIVQSAYDKLTSGRVTDQNYVMFVNVPSEGLLRIYTVSGQLMQQISWVKSDLVASGNGSPHGDLKYNLRTKEGLALSSGLYVYVLTARGDNANGKVARGKFVVIR